MTNLELIEYDPTPAGNGLSEKRTVVAVSTSYSSLVKYCKETYGVGIGKSKDNMWKTYYIIQKSKIIVVPEKHSK